MIVELYEVIGSSASRTVPLKVFEGSNFHSSSLVLRATNSANPSLVSSFSMMSERALATKEEGDNNTIYVVECKERSLAVGSEEYEKVSNKLFRKAREKGKEFFSLSQSGAMYKVIDNFEKEKVMPLRVKLQEFAKEINHPFRDGIKLIGLLATTELLEANEQISPGIELWTYWTLRKRVQEAKMDKSFIEIVEN